MRRVAGVRSTTVMLALLSRLEKGDDADGRNSSAWRRRAASAEELQDGLQFLVGLVELPVGRIAVVVGLVLAHAEPGGVVLRGVDAQRRWTAAAASSRGLRLARVSLSDA